MKTIKTSLALFFLMFATVGCSDSVVDAGASGDAALKNAKNNADLPNLVSVASSIDDFSILVDAVAYAGLVDALSGKGQLTVFAPTNTAFENLLQTLQLTPDELFDEAGSNRELVTSILLYHVAPGRKTSASLGRQVNTLNGAKAAISYQDAEDGEGVRVFIDNAEITAADITTFEGDRISNGLIHEINAVILPPDVIAALGL